jgi:hypothetical protein
MVVVMELSTRELSFSYFQFTAALLTAKKLVNFSMLMTWALHSQYFPTLLTQNTPQFPYSLLLPSLPDCFSI